MVRWLLPLVLASSVLASDSESCHPIEGIQPLLTPGTTLLLGEIHGTEESPAFALEVACHAARSGLPVVVGIELRPSEQERVDAYMNSDGADDDKRALLAGSPWQASYQDGRASHAMFDLIDGLRELRHGGLEVRAALFDASGSSGGQQRERDMARNLSAVAARSPGAMIIALTGNIHSRITRGTARNSEYEPMGYLLGRKDAVGRLISLNVAHAGGSAWICAPDCGVGSLRGGQGQTQWRVELDDKTRPPGHLGWYHVGAITASVPARMSPSEVPLPAPSPVKAEASRRPGEGVEKSARADSEREPNRELTDAEVKLQGTWQAYDYSAQTKTWLMRFDGRHFRAQAGEDDWYEGRIEIREGDGPAQIDFAIEECRCSYKGMTSEAIYRWDGDSLVVAAPRPGAPRPPRFVEMSGQMMRLQPVASSVGQ
jgi:uncharacterized protein (TIGR03067 family)